MTAYQREREALGQRLRELRREARLTGRQLAEALSWHPSKISKIEAGRQTPSEQDIESWTRACRRPSMQKELTAALRSLDSHYLEHRRGLRAGMTRVQNSIAAIEAEASAIRNFEPVVVPGLLQTPAYAYTRMYSGMSHYGADDIEGAVAARMDRQQILYRSGRRFHFVTAESAIRNRLCPPDVLLGQLDRLVTLTSLTTVRFGIIPFDQTYQRAPLHGFFVYDDRLVRIETLSAELSLEEPQEVETYLRYFAEFAERAVYGAEARALITRVMGELADELAHENESDEDAP